MTVKRKLLIAAVVLPYCIVASFRLCRAENATTPGTSAEKSALTLDEIRKQRKTASFRKRRIIFHSDGKPMDSPKMRFPFLPGTQTDSCTYSLIHQFNLARFYRTKVAQPWPPGYLEEYGDGPSDLQRYITFCRENNYEAFWAQRMNDTHDTADTENGRWKFSNNNFKQQHPEWLIGKKRWDAPKSPDGKWYGSDFIPCPNGRWSSVDYTHEEVRDLVFRSWEEVCQGYEIDGLMLDFFRHPTLFRSTAMGNHASREEVAMLSRLLRRTRAMADKIGAARGRPILLIARTPDDPRYAKALGMDIEHWMSEDLIDIWLAAGYFRMQEWKDIVELGNQHGVPVWASMDEVRTRRPDSNSPAAFRARAMNMWNAGIDGIYVFNFFYKPPSAEFNILHEMGEPAVMMYLPKMYVPDARGVPGVKYWLNGGEQYLTKKNIRVLPHDLTDGKPMTAEILVGDDLAAAKRKGHTPSAKLRMYVSGLADAAQLMVRVNGQEIKGGSLDAERNLVRFNLPPEKIEQGFNRFEVTLSAENNPETVLEDLQLWISYD